MNNNDELLINKMKRDGEFTQIEERPLRTYYTCVRYSHTILNPGSHGTVYYGPGQWSCMKGWFEMYDDTYRDKKIDSKILNYCRFINTEEALIKDINDNISLFIPKQQ